MTAYPAEFQHDAFLPGNTLRIRYTNNSGVDSDRKIRVNRVIHARYGKIYIKAHCFLRGEERTFRFDRIESFEILEKAPPIVAGHFTEDEAVEIPNVPISFPAVMYATPAKRYPPVKKRKTSAGRIAAVSLFVFIFFCLAISLVNINRPYKGFYMRQAMPAGELSVNMGGPFGEGMDDGNGDTGTGTVLFTFRGFKVVEDITFDGHAYLVPSLLLTGKSKSEIIRKVNDSLYIKETGISDVRILDLFAGADRNQDGELSWVEIKVFQDRLVDLYSYHGNSTALTPVGFLNEGGGDCEDWAVLTCALLKYWGIVSRVGSFSNPNAESGHALCLVRVAAPPRGFKYIVHKSAYWVPIDFDHVGNFSDVIGRNWDFTALRKPEDLYGKVM